MKNIIYEGDCLDFMRTMPDSCVDAVVTDPPFGIGHYYAGNPEQFSNPDDYGVWIQSIMAECGRVVRPGGFFAVWQAQLYFRHFWNWFGNDIHIYCAAKNFVQLRKTPVNYAYDPVVLWYKPGAPLRPQKPRRNVDFFVSNTVSLVSKPNRPERGHPCPRPLDVVWALVDNFVIPGGIVLDPFLGSGTTAIACLRTGRHIIGCETNSDYIRIAKSRLKAEAPGTAVEYLKKETVRR